MCGIAHLFQELVLFLRHPRWLSTRACRMLGPQGALGDRQTIGRTAPPGATPGVPRRETHVFNRNKHRCKTLPKAAFCGYSGMGPQTFEPIVQVLLRKLTWKGKTSTHLAFFELH